MSGVIPGVILKTQRIVIYFRFHNSLRQLYGGIFRIAPPGVAHIMETIRAQHMAAEAPAGGVAFIRHLHGAETDLVDRADIPAQWCSPGPPDLRTRPVMVAAVEACMKATFPSDDPRAASPHVAVKTDRAANIRRVDHNVRQPSRANMRRVASILAPCCRPAARKRPER